MTLQSQTQWPVVIIVDDDRGVELIAKLRERNVTTPAILIISNPNSPLSARAACVAGRLSIA